MTAFLFGTAIAQQAARATAPGEPPNVAAESSVIEENDKPLIHYGWYAFDEYKGDEYLISIYNESGKEEEPSGGVFTKFEEYDKGYFSSKRIKINGNHVSFGTESFTEYRTNLKALFYPTIGQALKMRNRFMER